MADSTEELPPEEQEVDGGAVKSFLEHLEDLRWMLVKSGAALLLGMCLCLFAVDELVAILKWPLDRAALIHENTETTQFFPGTFKNLPSMIARLKEPSDPVSSYLKERLSTKTIRMLADYGTDKVKPEVFQKSLIKDFNDIIDGDSIYTPERFKNVALRPETTNQMGKSSWFSKPVLLNRMLLEDAYPQEFSKNHFNGQRLTIFMDKIRLGTYDMKTNRIGSFELGTNYDVDVRLEPVEKDGQMLLALKLLPASEAPIRTGPKLIYMDPAAPFMASLHIAFFGGLFISCPFVFYYIGQFLMPALKIREKKYFLRAFYIGVGLFILGVCVAYFGIMPRALKVAEQYSHWMGIEMPEWKAEEYFSFLVKFMLGMGAGFELPVVLLALVKIGILNYAKLKAMRRYMIVINLIAGALLTTPEVVTQVAMGICLQILFEISVWVAWYWEKKKKKEEPAED